MKHVSSGMKGKITPLTSALLIFTLTFGFYTSPTMAAENPEKITFCHVQNPDENPFKGEVLTLPKETAIENHLSQHNADYVINNEVDSAKCLGEDQQEDPGQECEFGQDETGGCLPEPTVVVVCHLKADNTYELISVNENEIGDDMFIATDKNKDGLITVEDCEDNDPGEECDPNGDCHDETCVPNEVDDCMPDDCEVNGEGCPAVVVVCHLKADNTYELISVNENEIGDDMFIATDKNKDGLITVEDCEDNDPGEECDPNGDCHDETCVPNEVDDCMPDDCEVNGEGCPDGGNGGNDDEVKLCHIKGDVFKILGPMSQMDAQKHLDDEMNNEGDDNDFIINDNDNDEKNDTADCQPPHNGGGGGNGGHGGGGHGGNGGDDGGNGGDDGGNGGDDGGNGGDDGGNGGDDGGSDSNLDLASDPGLDCPEGDFKDYGYSSGPEYDRLVTTWIRCEDIAHGLGDNNEYYSPDEAITFSHFVKMVARSGRIGGIANEKHVLGSDVTRYFDLAVEKGILEEDDRQYLNMSITLEKAEAITSKVLGYVVNFDEDRTDGLLGRKTAAQSLFELFAS